MEEILKSEMEEVKELLDTFKIKYEVYDNRIFIKGKIIHLDYTNKVYILIKQGRYHIIYTELEYPDGLKRLLAIRKGYSGSGLGVNVSANIGYNYPYLIIHF